MLVMISLRFRTRDEYASRGVHQKCLEAISKKSFRPIRRSKMPLAVRRTSIGVVPSSQVLDILEYACGLILGLALISTENPNFEITSNVCGF